MAKIEDLIDEVADPRLREELAVEVREIKETKRFGLVFEEHIPETVSLFGLPIRPGLAVQNRTTPDDLTEYQVLAIEEGKATVVPRGADEPEMVIDATDLLVVKRFHEPIYPGLKVEGKVREGPTEKPNHVVLNGENFHALELLVYAYAQKVDCIYIDPPYNTGDKSWKYNNDYVDRDDRYRHSKWLAMMDRRLRLAKELLNSDESVLIVTVDEKEYLRLGLLLEELFPEAKIQMITSVISPGGVSREVEFTRVNEFIFFVMLGSAVPVKTPSDLLFTPYRSASKNRSPIWRGLLRGGSGPLRKDSPTKFFPIFVDPDTRRVVGAGEPLPLEESREGYEAPTGVDVVWPLKTGGVEGRWELSRPTFDERLEKGYVRVGGFNKKNDQWTMYYLRNAEIQRLKGGELVSGGMTDQGHLDLSYSDEVGRSLFAKTVWNDPAHDAGTHGSSMLKALIPGRKFPYPKSLYAVEDCLHFFVKDKPDALIVDFFAGSGTTGHAVMRLNQRDGGSRRSILVTNNEVSPDEAKALRKRGVFPGDSEWESLGIFHHVTMPRIKAAISGKTPDGDEVKGDYKFRDEFAIGEGLPENVTFMTIEYLDRDLVELGRQFNAINPMLWMAAGSIGSLEQWDGEAPWLVPAESNYAVLFNEKTLGDFLAHADLADVSHIWLVTNSSSAFTEMRSALPDSVRRVQQLYADYLRNFVVNAPGVLRR